MCVNAKLSSGLVLQQTYINDPRNMQLLLLSLLVGGFSPYPSEKYDFVSWDDDIPFPIHMENHNPFMFQSAPIRYQIRVNPRDIPRFPMGFPMGFPMVFLWILMVDLNTTRQYSGIFVRSKDPTF